MMILRKVKSKIIVIMRRDREKQDNSNKEERGNGEASLERIVFENNLEENALG